MGIEPAAYDPLADVVPMDRLEEIFATLRREVAAAAASAPTHDSYFTAA
jgi:hypothetical protein